MKTFLSCDWGTSSFRLRLINAQTLKVLGQTKTDEGISQIYRYFKLQKVSESDRFAFYLSTIQQNIKQLERDTKRELDGIPIVLSGMASSTIGMFPLQYKPLPFSTDGSNLLIKRLKATKTFPHELIFISGVRSVDDVMRGEETLLVGCYCLLKVNGALPKRCLFIVPGTHSKHIVVEEQEVSSFKTFMTGEFFSLLSTHSILSDSIDTHRLSFSTKNKEFFRKGVSDGLKFNLLNSSFWIRTNSLFDLRSKKQNYFYLSGLLIGNEIRELDKMMINNVILVSSKELARCYSIAIEVLGLSINLNVLSDEDAMIHGQNKICGLQ